MCIRDRFLVERAESIYVSTKPMGLPKATALVPVVRNHDRAAARFADGRTAVRAAAGQDAASSTG